eukprot:366336-Chlamydomonas_euryale.AAC.34
MSRAPLKVTAPHTTKLHLTLSPSSCAAGVHTSAPGTRADRARLCQAARRTHTRCRAQMQRLTPQVMALYGHAEQQDGFGSSKAAALTAAVPASPVCTMNHRHLHHAATVEVQTWAWTSNKQEHAHVQQLHVYVRKNSCAHFQTCVTTCTL